MITISVTEGTRGELLKIARQIQKEACDKTDFDTVIRFLIDSYSRKTDLKRVRSFKDERRDEEGKPRDNPHQS